jgi:hypothetical protein
MNDTHQSQAIKDLIIYLEKFGFKYLGPGEHGDVLFTAPNGQVVPGEIAYKFVKTQLVDPSKTSTGGTEAMPTMPNVIPSNFDSNFDSRIESEKSLDEANKIEKAKEQSQESGESKNQSELKVKDSSPKMKNNTAIPMPFGDGFMPKSFKPDDTASIQDFISKKASATHSDPAAWLKVMWEKFLKELSSK